MKVLVLCTGNSCRSQMAQGFLQSFHPEWEVLSAGTRPAEKVNKYAIKVMAEKGIDITGEQPKLVDQFIQDEFDYVITVCDGAREVCPVFIGKVKHRVHIGFDDPADAVGSDEEIMPVYRRVRDEIEARFLKFPHIMDTIGFIGGGRVTRIILHALMNSGMKINGISVYDPNPVVLENLEHLFPGIAVNADDLSQVAGSSTLFLAVHPPFMMETLTAVKPYLKSETVIISLAPKFTIAKMSSVLENLPNIARINPSASSYINEGINPVCYANSMNADARASLVNLMKPLGAMPEVEENKIEAYAMISAMGHTYFWFQIQKLKELAIGFGMSEDEAKEVISGMMKGTVKTLFDSGLDYDEVIDLVPVKPLAPVENIISGFYDDHLTPLFNKIKS